MAATFGLVHIPVVIDGQENMGDMAEIGQGQSDALGILIFHQQKGHGRSEEHDVGLRVFGQDLSFQELFPEGNVLKSHTCQSE